MSEFPKGWTIATLGEVGTIGSSRRVKKNDWGTEGVPFYRAREIAKLSREGSVENDLFISEELYETLSQTGQVPETGDVMITGVGTIGVPYIVKESDRFYFKDASVLILKKPDCLIPEFIFYFIQSNGCRRAIMNGSKGTTVDTLTISRASDLSIPIPPLPEQRRIVARIEELFSRLDAGVAALRHAKAQLQRYRQSVLAAAVTGQLTQAWREQHPDTEPADSLKATILDDREKSWPGKYKQPITPEVPEGFEIPESWCWMSTDELLTEPLKNGLSLKGFPEPPGVAVLKLDALTENGFDYSRRQYLRTDSRKVPEIRIERGDFLISRGNGTLRLLAKGALAGDVQEEVIFPDTMIRFRFPTNTQQWISAAWQSRVLRSQIESRAKTTAGIYKVAQGDLRPIAVPIPPVAEQKRIVAEVESRTTAIDHLEAGLDSQIVRSDRLRQSTLREAFSGNLVPQNPNDEPASSLLQASKAAQEKTPKKKTPTRKKPMKSRKPANLRAEILEAVGNLPNDRFSFEELFEAIKADYDQTKEAIFELLEEAEPEITQEFDDTSNRVVLARNSAK